MKFHYRSDSEKSNGRIFQKKKKNLKNISLGHFGPIFLILGQIQISLKHPFLSAFLSFGWISLGTISENN